MSNNGTFTRFGASTSLPSPYSIVSSLTLRKFAMGDLPRIYSHCPLGPIGSRLFQSPVAAKWRKLRVDRETGPSGSLITWILNIFSQAVNSANMPPLAPSWELNLDGQGWQIFFGLIARGNYLAAMMYDTALCRVLAFVGSKHVA